MTRAALKAAGAALSLLTVLAGALFAQGTTGKIEGTVRDQVGAPIAGAQVLILASAYSTSSNEQGYYFLNNVPAGVITVRAQYIGYAPAETREVRVLAGQTMTVDLALEPRAIELGGITVTLEENPLVPRDQVTTKPIVSGDLIDALPVDNINQVLRLQPGVVEGDRGLVIRGGRPGEAAVYIDGVEVRNLSRGLFNRSGLQSLETGQPRTVNVGTNAVQEASVTTGAVGAEFGDAQSGVISIVTRAGGSSLRGAVSYATDAPSGTAYSQGLSRIEASLGGPISHNLTFFLGTTVQGQQNPQLGAGREKVPIYVQNGLDTSNPEAPSGTVTVPLDPGNTQSDSTVVHIPSFTRYSSGSRLPDAWADAFTLNGKLQYTFGTGSRASLSYLSSRDQQMTFTDFGLITSMYDQQARTGQRQNSRALILNYTQNLATSSERALFLEVNASWQRDDFTSGDLDPSWWEQHRVPTGWFSPSSMRFLVNRDNFPVDDRLITDIRLGGAVCTGTRRGPDGSPIGACVPYLERSDLFAKGAFRTNPYGVTAGLFPERGYSRERAVLARETRLTARVNMDWQAGRYNRVRAGGDWLQAREDSWTSELNSRVSLDAHRNSPWRAGLFLNDRLDLGDVVLEAGVRYDRFDPDLLFPRAFGRTFLDPLREGHSSVAFTHADTLMAGACGALFGNVNGGTGTYADSAALSTCNMVAAPGHSSVSPSLRVAFPVTDRTGFRFSYSQQVQQPDFNLMARRANSDLSYTGGGGIYGAPLTYGQATLFEFGIRHAFSNDVVLDVSAYNKDHVSGVGSRYLTFPDVHTGTTETASMLVNVDFGNARGVDVKLDVRAGSLLNGSLSYTLQRAASTGSDPYEYFTTLGGQLSLVTEDRTPPPEAALPSRDDRTHTIAGAVTLAFPHQWQRGHWYGAVLQDAGMFATFRFASGLPFTRMVNDGNGQLGPGNGFGAGIQAEPLNASRTPWIRNVDLRVTRAFRVGTSRDLTLFADFRNLFNWTNITAIFAETGDVRNARYEAEQLTDIISTLYRDADTLARNDTVVARAGLTTTRYDVDLRDCHLWRYGAGGIGGMPDCLLLRGAERRFGDGNRDFTVEEQDRAFMAYYDAWAGPQTLRGPPLNLRLGFELHF